MPELTTFDITVRICNEYHCIGNTEPSKWFEFVQIWSLRVTIHHAYWPETRNLKWIDTLTTTRQSFVLWTAHLSQRKQHVLLVFVHVRASAAHIVAFASKLSFLPHQPGSEQVSKPSVNVQPKVRTQCASKKMDEATTCWCPAHYRYDWLLSSIFRRQITNLGSARTNFNNNSQCCDVERN